MKFNCKTTLQKYQFVCFQGAVFGFSSGLCGPSSCDAAELSLALNLQLSESGTEAVISDSVSKEDRLNFDWLDALFL